MTETTDSKATLMILGENVGTPDKLEADLLALGYDTVVGQYPDVDTGDIVRQAPPVILLQLATWDDDALTACELLLSENVLRRETAVVALIPENIMGKIPLDFEFADTLISPYSNAELGFRLRRVIHHYRWKASNDIISIGDIAISLSNYEVRVGGRLVTLSLKEYELLSHLVTHPGRVLTRDALLNSVWGYDYFGGTRTVDVHIRRVRAKIGDLNETYIKTVRGVGYSFRADIE